MRDRPANILRGEASLTLDSGIYVLRPSFEALIAAEEELGSLFGLVERAAGGKLLLSEIVTFFWHIMVDRPEEWNREGFGEALTALGLAKLTPPLKILLKQILAGQAPDDNAV